MMVHVQVAPAHPLFFRQLSEDGMLRKFVGARRAGEPLEQLAKFGDVAGEFGRLRAAEPGVTLRDSGYPMGPACREPQRRPFEESAGEPVADRLCVSFT